MNKPRPVDSVILNRQGSTHRLVERAQQLQQLDRYLKQQLPATLADHCHVANVREGLLVIQADSSAWASRLRYSAPQLLNGMRRLPALTEVTAVRVTVAPGPTAPRETPRSEGPTLSAANASLLRQTAETLAEDSPLRAALERLANRAVS